MQDTEPYSKQTGVDALTPLELPQVDVGVFGGSGFYDLLDDATEYRLTTPFGAPSDVVTVGRIGDRTVAFLPRHGRGHALPPHRINYRANVWAMKMLGVTRLIGPSASGSLQPEVKPGDFVIVDQFVDRTQARADTFFDGSAPEGVPFFEGRGVVHVSAADPYCPELRALAGESCDRLGISAHKSGTSVVIQGPRFSTRAESQWFSRAGWEVVNMTQYPEGFLARELELCYVNIALITDYDAGVDSAQAVTNKEVMDVFAQNLEKLKALLYDLIPRIPRERYCLCGSALSAAEM
ncbi:MAG: S-methyl-5'-thioadenosine phosphorylase [Actinomycetes bacterium]|jgi:5'-methylthioadenosine phosphorylase|nr:S-methyl-5'-thioadenosine phosphorylase [Actinomycetes bacterium]